MKNKVVTLIFGLIAAAIVIGTVQAQIHATIEVKDGGGNLINGGSVPLGTTVSIYGSYTDDLGAPAAALMEVYYAGSPSNFNEILYSGSINSGAKVVKTYALTNLGSYEFRWTVTKTLGSTSTTEAPTVQCIQQKAFANTTITAFVIPEPATIAGLAMALSALGLLAVKRTRR